MRLILIGLSVFISTSLMAQLDANSLIRRVKEKYEQVRDYEASGLMKTNVSFIKVPMADVKIYYRSPNKMKIKNEKGVSFIPKGSVNVNMNNVLGLHDYQVLDAGSAVIDNKNVRVIKVLPNDENASDVIVSTLYIDEKNLLVLKSKTTTKENGTYDILMKYDKYATYGLPSYVMFSFNTKGYKMPKGITFDYDNGAFKEDKDKTKPKTGKVEITYKSYVINKGVKDSVFN
jgi:outer membrane lipoprotein-sorting protein